ncbi:MAG: DUF1269 domain-containing protein [Gammaproteobacteria bacterium]|nr:DUF1269 domain-containing protein [Gammaproteobacteria bacterium]
MLRRLYFLLPDVKTAHQVEQELLLARIDDRRMHFMAKDGVNLGDLPEASIAQKSDYVHGMGVGLIAGACTGALVGLISAWLYWGNTPTGVVVTGLLVITGASFGVWVSGMIGASVPNTQLKVFTEDLERGLVLLMVDLPLHRIDDVKALIKRHHPNAEDHGLEPNVPAFP